MWKAIIIVTAYFIGAIISYGNIYNNEKKERDKWCVKNEIIHCDDSFVELSTVAPTLGWPLYYGFHYSRLWWQEYDQKDSDYSKD